MNSTTSDVPSENTATDLRLSFGSSSLLAAIVLAFWAVYSLKDSTAQAGLAAGLSIALTVITLRRPLIQVEMPGVDIRFLAALGIRSELARDVAIAVFVMTIAAICRLIALGSFPGGLHADEGVAGFEAQRIMREGWIGPYSREALGVPAGLFYWSAVVFRFAGESIWSLRFASALLGIATVGLQYAAVRVWFDRRTALIAALWLAVSAWHIYFSRTAFIPIGAPPCVMLTLLCLGIAVKRQSPAWFAVSGLALASGLYFYQAYLGFIVGIAATFLVFCVVFRPRAWRALVLPVSLVVLSAGLVLLPIVRLANDDHNLVLGRFQSFSVTKSPDFEGKGLLEKVNYLREREVGLVQEIFAAPKLDGVDASGRFRLVDLLSGGLIVVGVGIAISRARAPSYFFLLLLALILISAPVFVMEGGHRRSLMVAPFLGVFAALTITFLADWAAGQFKLPERALGIGVASAIIAVAALNLVPYFRDYNNDPNVEGVLGELFLPGIEEISSLDDRVYVLLYSERITYGYPTRQFLAPNNPGEDRSEEFGREGFDLSREGDRDTLFMFMGKYRSYATQVSRLYPGGQLIVGPDTPDGPAYRAYFLPADPNAEPLPASLTKDAERRADLNDLSAALVAYKAAKGVYPSTDSNVQTACRFESIDQLCGLRPFGGTTFQDPTGEGYWYSSDGKSFTLYASLEGPVDAGESCKPRELAQVANLLCVTIAR